MRDLNDIALINSASSHELAAQRQENIRAHSNDPEAIRQQQRAHGARVAERQRVNGHRD